MEYRLQTSVRSGNTIAMIAGWGKLCFMHSIARRLFHFHFEVLSSLIMRGQIQIVNNGKFNISIHTSFLTRPVITEEGSVDANAPT